MASQLVFFVAVMGVALFILGFALDGHGSPIDWAGVIGYAALAASFGARLVASYRLRHAEAHTSPLASELIPVLAGSYTPYVMEAAARLGEARDATAVPALLRVLEETAEMQAPGWRDRAESFTAALGLIGDRRALPLLYRLENVRGIGFIPAVRAAIASIEPQTSLLRPGGLNGFPADLLLRPADHGVPGHETELLVRPSE